jgi:2-polyprenyl-6-methoxyphenol hydroxylase-like FAD-dependent oxidoreductase
MDVVVVGAGIAGLGTALMLGQAGHTVTLLERDPPPPADPDEAWESWERRGVPQLRLAHVFLGRMRNMLRDEQPALYAEVRAAGAMEMTWHESLPATMADRTPRPIDDDLVMLGMRRPVFEHHLRRAIERAGVELRSSTAVAGVVAGASVVAGIPHVSGVRLEDGTTIDADLVVDCGGRRSAIPEWLASLGAPPMPEEEVEDGLMYFGRYYKLEDGEPYPDIEGGPIIDLGYLFGLTFRADAGWFAIALAVHNEDKAIRALRDEDVFEAVLQAIPKAAKWRVPGRSRAMSPVASMSRIDDRWRDFVVDGTPLATGLLPLGDSLVCTNPSLGRGSSLGWVAGRALVGVLDRNGTDPVAAALDYDTEIRREIRPWFEQTAQMDADRLAHMRRVLAGEPDPPIDENDPMAAFGTGFQLGSQVHPEIYRGLGQVAHVLKQPIELLGDPELAAAVIGAWEQRESIAQPATGPSRDELLAVMAQAPRPAQGAQVGSPAAAR